MYLVKATSGLGNQLFQYAFYRSLQSKHPSIKVLLDNSSFETFKYRKWGLDNFNTKYKLASQKEIEVFKQKNRNPLLYLNRYFELKKYGFYRICNNHVFVKPRSKFSEKIFAFNDNFYFQGFFMDQRYFQNIRAELLTEITIKPNLVSNDLKLILERIISVDSVSIHIRRGDYLTHKVLNTLSISYYNTAIKYIKDKLNKPFFFIFSDDIQWVKNNLKVDGQHEFINCKDYEDLFLMSSCNHNIIANSTFSWWAAWINKNKNGIKIAPNIWYKTKKAQQWYQNSEMISSQWIKL